LPLCCTEVEFLRAASMQGGLSLIAMSEMSICLSVCQTCELWQN